MKELSSLQQEAIELLKELIRLPSFSGEEWETASLLTKFLFDRNVAVNRVGNNVLALNKYFDESRPMLLLNSHHDTVRPNKGYTRDPFSPEVVDGKLFGLGSTDAGGALVSLIATFLFFYEKENLPFNIALAATAEEENSGKGGIELALQHLPSIHCAIVGEPTQMQLAIAERGLMVLDGVATGKAGHAARGEGENAIYKAMQDINWLSSFQFERVSHLLGPVKLSVTSIETENKTHNIVPSECRYIVDVRINELYSHEEVLGIIQRHVHSTVNPRSCRLRSSVIHEDHPLVQAGMAMGKSCYGSPTSSDKALMSFPALKMGPGDSARSHTADEFIFLTEIEEGIADYIQLLQNFFAIEINPGNPGIIP
jgi:acetylornithine deacetylase